ncbi:MAG: hypothetical protein LC804_26945 [Acidobacteria bacterium]|nr:hypothetical protein [Acidobacteriota bacterium]
MKKTIAAFCLAASVASVALAADKAKTVTLTGCVRNNGDRNSFVLTKVEGVAAPRARGWKTAYLLKRPGKVEVVAGATSVKVRDHVGRRVAVTGTMEQKGRTVLKARSIRVISSCA